MKVTSRVNERYCFRCRKETEHVIIFLDNYLKAGRCIVCGEEFHNRKILFDVYMRDFVERILSKPIRVLHESEHISPARRRELARYRRIMDRLFKKPFKEFHNFRQVMQRCEFHDRNGKC